MNAKWMASDEQARDKVARLDMDNTKQTVPPKKTRAPTAQHHGLTIQHVRLELKTHFGLSLAEAQELVQFICRLAYNSSSAEDFASSVAAEGCEIENKYCHRIFRVARDHAERLSCFRRQSKSS